MKNIVLILLYLSSTCGHLCLWQPMQRGNMSLNPPGSHDCYRKIQPCGGFNSSTSRERTTIESGSIYQVLFQQHINHYYPLNPGKLDISFAHGLEPLEEDFQILSSLNDYNPMNHNTQTNFSINVQIPNEECDQCVLRVRYITNNPDEEDHGMTFYQCSDIKLIKTSQNSYKSNFNPIQSINHKNDSHDCCSPSSFQTSFIHVIPDIDYLSTGIVYYDKLLKQMRFQMNMMGINYNMWMNFTSGKQYYHNVNNNSCHLFGLNYWNDWCYGNTFNQTEDFTKSNISCTFDLSNNCNQWINGDFLFESTLNRCYPSSLFRLSSNEKTIYFDQKDGPFSPEIFQPDPICLKQNQIYSNHCLKHLINPLN
ncbi:hypothetical protein I4U23_023225 [Adineta vaga]|nr:hypothetical protein I4U23_023225 [Adineta vaga]